MTATQLMYYDEHYLLADWDGADKTKVMAAIALLAISTALGALILVAAFLFVSGHLVTRKKYLRVLFASLFIRCKFSQTFLARICISLSYSRVTV